MGALWRRVSITSDFALAQLGIRPALNLFTHEVMVEGDPLEEATVDRVWVQIDDVSQRLPPDERDVAHRARRPKRNEVPIIPSADTLDGLTWDGVPRLDERPTHLCRRRAE